MMRHNARALPHSILMASVSALILSGCAAVPDLGPKPQATTITTLESQQSLRGPEAGWPVTDWWTGYGDAQLTSLIAEGLAQSPDIAMANARVRAADALARQAGAALLPQIGATAHAGGVQPRTRPHRIAYPDLMGDVLDRTLSLAARAVTAGVEPARVLIDPAHDFAKNTWHSLTVTRELHRMVATGWPVLVSLSNKDFVGETLDLPLDRRLNGTLAATAICAWHGARVFRAHNVGQTREVLDMVSSIRGDRPPARATRGLA